MFEVENHAASFAIFGGGRANKIAISEFIVSENFVIAADGTDFHEENITEWNSVVGFEEEQLSINAGKGSQGFFSLFICEVCLS